MENKKLKVEEFSSGWKYFCECICWDEIYLDEYVVQFLIIKVHTDNS